MTTKECTKCNTNKLLKDFYKDKTKVDGYRYECKECTKSKAKEHHHKNRDHQNRVSRQWRLNNLEHVSRQKKGYYQRNAEAILEQKRDYYRRNTEAIKKKVAKHAKNNRDAYNARAAKYRATKLRATPPWADLDKIKEVYTEAQRLTKLLGIEMQVDHIVPLKGKLVSGLHVHDNLQILTYVENGRKTNKFEVG